jgi:hypothetical protein
MPTVPKSTRHDSLLLIGLANLAVLACSIVPSTAAAGVLPDDRADILYHRYDGGGITIHGPSVLMRKKLGEKFAASANYYVDMVTSASVDVELTASPYKEERTQKSVSFDYLHGKSTYSAGIINSEESDYTADTSFFSISQDMFGDLTTVTLSYRRGWDEVTRNLKTPEGDKISDPAFAARANDRRGYAVSLSQVLTRDMILALNYEVQTDEGFLNNPYRQVRFLDPLDPRGWRSEAEIYPRTHTSNAVSARLKYFLPYRAAIDGTYRFFSDSWGIDAHTLEVGYTHPARKRWIFDGKARYYKQTAADFYRDLFPRQNFSNFMARDKELSTFQGVTIGLGAEYEFAMPVRWIQKSAATFRWDHLMIQYDDFRDARVTKNDPGSIAAGAEPLYELDADVLQLFVSIWF